MAGLPNLMYKYIVEEGKLGLCVLYVDFDLLVGANFPY